MFHTIAERLHRTAGATALPNGSRIDVIDRLTPAWDAIVGEFDDAAPEQMAAYMQSRWNSTRLRGLVLRDQTTNEPIAAALAVVATMPIVHRGLAYVKFGPMWRRRGGRTSPAVLRVALAALRQGFAADRHLLLRVMPPADPDFGPEWQAALAASGFARHAAVAAPERYLVDLTLSEHEQRASLGAKWRANLNKAAALDIHEVNLREALPGFMALYHGMVTRKQFVDRHGIHALPAFAAAAPESLGLRLVFAFHEGTPVAGSLLVSTGERVYVPFSASDAHAPALRAGYALRWWIINRLRGSNARWLDLGGAEGDEGLRSFKSGNVGKRGRIVPIPGEFDYSESALSAALTGAMTATRKLDLGSRLNGLFRRG